MIFLATRGKADAAIAHHDGCHPMRGRRAEFLTPDRLAIIVRVHIDKSGRDNPARGVDLLCTFTGYFADGYNLAAYDRQIAFEWRGTCAINDTSAANYEIVISHARPASPGKLQHSFSRAWRLVTSHL